MLDVKKIRKKLNLTQTNLSDKLQVNLRTVQKWESGETKMSGEAVLAIQDLLNELEGVENDNTSYETLKSEINDLKTRISLLEKIILER